MENYKKLIESLCWQADHHRNDSETAKRAADAIEALTAELIDERDNHDRLQDFEVAESQQLTTMKDVAEKATFLNQQLTVDLVKKDQELEKAEAVIHEWEKYRQDLLIAGKIPPKKWEAQDG